MPPAEHHSVYCVRPRRFNVGNETINLATRALLREAFGQHLTVVPVPAMVSAEEGSVSGLTASTVHEMNRHASGVVIGGGNLYENGQLDLDPQALSALRPPLLLFSLSHGRIYDHRGQLQPRTDAMPDARILALHRMATGSLARDDATLDHLEGLGIQGAVMAGCPTLLLDQLAGPASASRVGSGATLLSIRNPALMNIPPGQQARVQGEVQRTIDVLESRGHGPVQLLCHDRRDLEFAASFADVPSILPDDVHDYLAMLRGASLVVSYRLHATLPCLSVGTPVVNVSYDERSMSLVRAIGLGDWDVPFVGTADVAEAIADRVDRLDALPGIVDAARPLWAELARRARGAVEEFADAARDYAALVQPVA